jgi:uncharacterized protein
MAAVETHPITVRRSPFEFPEHIPAHWIPHNPEFSQMVNGASLTMPYLEPFLMRTMREALRQVRDPAIQEEGAAFIAQEGQHFQTHRRFNDLLKRKGYEGLAEVEARMEENYARLEKRSLRTRLAYTAGFEAMTLGVTKWLVTERFRLFGGADPHATSFVMWHMVEETEHKLAAFDVYQAVCGGYWARAFGVLHGTLDVVRFSMQAYKVMLRKDGLWTQWRSRLRLAGELWGFVRYVSPYLLRALLPGHNPRNEPDEPWVLEWIEAYARNPLHVPLVDTRDPRMPVPFPVAAA